MSLHCPATIWLVPAGTRPEALATVVGEERVGGLYVAPGLDGPAGAMASGIGTEARQVPGEPGEGATTADLLLAVADLHRGECAVLVVPTTDLDRPRRVTVGD